MENSDGSRSLTFAMKSVSAAYTKTIEDMLTVFALAVMEYAVGVSKFGKNPMTL